MNAALATLLLVAAPHWTWTGDAGDVELNLVRASVRVVHRPGPARIAISARGRPGLGEVRIVADQDGRRLRLTDVYPPHSGVTLPGECAPPPGSRGDFLHSDIVLDAVLAIPPETSVSGHIMARRDVPVR